jgi:hypothetical protein
MLCMALSVFLAGCSHQPPSIQFSKVPPVNEGGPDRVATIEGNVEGARPRQRIVLFAKSEVWWVQPLAQKPYTAIGPNGNWSSSTHLGTDYAALLVDPEYQPPSVVGTLPSVGNGVVAVATIKGSPSPSGTTETPFKTVRFSNYDWKVRSIRSRRGGMMRSYDPANVSIDDSGHLHLKITRRSDEWVCSEVSLTRSLGYGTYTFTVQDISHLEPSAVLGMYTWSELGVDQNHREMNIDISRWGDPESKNAQYAVQPYYVPANVVRFSVPAGPMSHSLRWEPGSAAFTTVHGDTRTAAAHSISSHVFTSGIPSPGEEFAYINFCPWGYGKVQMEHEAEVVIEKFQYLP